MVWAKWGSQWWGFGKAFNVLQSPIGKMAFRPMRNIETLPSKQMYLYLSLLVETKVAEFFHNIERRCFLVWLKWLSFIAGQLMVSLWNCVTLIWWVVPTCDCQIIFFGKDALANANCGIALLSPDEWLRLVLLLVTHRDAPPVQHHRRRLRNPLQKHQKNIN